MSFNHMKERERIGVNKIVKKRKEKKEKTFKERERET